MIINREDFLSNLQLVKSGLSTREFIEQSACFAFQDKEVMTFNDEVACRMNIGFRLTGAVQATLLLDILGKLDEEELTIEEEDGQLVFLGKRKQFKLVKDAEVHLPIDRVEKPETWLPLAKKFTEAIGHVRHCVSGDQSRFILTCIHIHPDYIEACDNKQIMRFSTQTKIKSDVLVRGTSLESLVDLGMAEYSITKSWIHFRNAEGLVYSARRYQEDYPDVSKLLVVKGDSIVIPKGMAKAAERAALFATDKAADPLLSVTLNDGMIQVVGAGNGGIYKERKKVHYDGPYLEFLIAPDTLGHIASKYEEATLGGKKLKVTGEQWEYVTVLGLPKAKELEESPKKGKRSAKDEEEE